MPNDKNVTNDLYVIFYHPELSIISEKTFRRLLKDISKICHKALLEELEYLMRELKLDNRQKQSIKGRTLNKIAAGSFYYLEDFRRDSVFLEVSITGLALWLLNITLGESFKAAARKSHLLKKLEEILSKKINIRNYIKRRPKKLAEIVSNQLEGEGTLNRFEIDKIEYKVTIRHELHVTLKTEETVDVQQISVKYDANKLQYDIESEIKKIEESIQEEKNKDTDR